MSCLDQSLIGPPLSSQCITYYFNNSLEPFIYDNTRNDKTDQKARNRNHRNRVESIERAENFLLCKIGSQGLAALFD